MWLEEEGEDGELKSPAVFCMQAEHTGTRTYYFSSDSHEEQEEWIRAMSKAAEVNDHLTERCCYSFFQCLSKAMIYGHIVSLVPCSGAV